MFFILHYLFFNIKMSRPEHQAPPELYYDDKYVYDILLQSLNIGYKLFILYY